MNTTFRALIGSTAAGLILLTRTAAAGIDPGAVATLTAASTVGQAAQGDPRRECLDRLARARQAMDEGKWEIAESLVDQADRLNVSWGRFHLGDTPQKARRDLERRRAKGAGKTPADPFQTAKRANPAAAQQAELPKIEGPAPAGRATAAPQTVTFPKSGDPPPAGRVDLSRGSGFSALPPPERTPFDEASTPTGAVATDVPPAGAMPREAAANSADSRAQSDALLVGARRSLAVGDVQRAQAMVEQAKQLGFRYGFHDDTPAKIETTIRRHVDLLQQASSRDSEAYRRRQVELLMEQSEALVAWKELDEAERLANDARSLPVNFGAFDAKPDDLLRRIAAERQNAGRGAPAEATRMSAAQEPTPGAPQAIEAAATDGLPAAPTAGEQAPPKEHALALVRQAREALQAGDVRRAERLALQARSFNIPDSAYGRGEDRAELVLWDINKQRNRGQQQAVVPAGGAMPVPAAGGATPPGATQAMYDAANDNTRVRPAQAQIDLGPVPPTTEPVAAPLPQGPRPGAESSLMEKTAAEKQVIARKVSAELAGLESDARRLQESEPKRALEVLNQARAMVQAAQGIDTPTRELFLRRVDRRVQELENYIDANRAQIELAERNQAVRDENDRNRNKKVEVDGKLAKMIDDFNKLIDEERYAEAEVVAKRAQELAPNEPIVQQVVLQAKFIRRVNNIADIQDQKERRFVDTLTDVEVASIPFPDSTPFKFGPTEDWETLSKSKFRMLRDGRTRRSEKEIEIEKQLRTPVSLKFQDAPLIQVMNHLQDLTKVNLHLDPKGLAEEGVTTDTPVTIDLTEEITLRSALNLILEPLNLSFVIKNEVLNITSEQLKDGEVYQVAYNVADLVISIPNFTPNGRIGLTGALQDSLSNLRPGGVGSFSPESPLAVVASNSGANASAMIDPRVLAQLGAPGPGAMGAMGTPGPAATGSPQPMGFGPGGLGGGAIADFDSLINLITQTIQPTTWTENGGPGAVQPFFPNLSLVVSQTQEVHDEIAELLDQLRRLQDLQVTIEVRFITLNDNFFERIGVDFDFDINDNAPASAIPTGSTTPSVPLEDRKRHLGEDVTVGLQAPGLFSADMDIPFNQNTFTLATPQFGGFANGQGGAQLGFAILSDIEAFFFIEAAQGDRRSNVLQAPKVTLFNGQLATVSDISQSPFVISVIPVVGDFAAAQQPVIVVLSEGTFLTVQAVVSSDRRFVRLTVVPFFSNIGDVNTFTFTGSSTSTEDDSSEGKIGDTTGRTKKTTTSSEGTTVQLPTFSFVSVSTTVSVPDGGTVLLGGIKRLSEGRNEFGVPVLNKLPYINRLFRNVGIGRETQSLMMMVTPRIIIQEEEEFNLTGQQPTP